MLNKLNINYLYLSAIVLVFAVWLKAIATHEPFIHPEFLMTAGIMAAPIEPGKSGMSKIFDSTDTELGYYRPRVVSFAMQYLDANFVVFITKKIFPQWGARLIGYYLSIFLIIMATLYLAKSLFPTQSFAFRLLLATFPITWINTQGTLLVTLRSAKLLCVASIIYMFTIFIKSEKWEFNWPNTQKLIFYSLLFTAFCLVDEQNTSLLCLFTFSSIALSLYEKKMRSFIFYGCLALVIYFLLYNTVLFALFAKYTPAEIFKPYHRHNLSLLWQNFSWDIVEFAVNLYGQVNFDNLSILLIFGLLVLLRCLQNRDYSLLLNATILLAGGPILVLGLSLTHTQIVSHPDLKVFMYFLPVITLSYCLILYLAKEASLGHQLYSILALSIVGLSFFNLAQVDNVANTIRNGHLKQASKLSDWFTASIINKVDNYNKISVHGDKIEQFYEMLGSPTHNGRGPAVTLAPGKWLNPTDKLSDDILLAGYSVRAAEGTWTDGPKAIVHFAMPSNTTEGTLLIEAAPYLNENHHEIQVSAEIMGEIVASKTFSSPIPEQFVIPIKKYDINDDGSVWITLKMDKPVSPPVGDDRKLGIFISRYKLMAPTV